MAILKLTTEFDEGQIVYVKTDPHQYPRLVVGYTYSQEVISYIIALDSERISYSGYELTTEPNDIITSIPE